jgi:hypothetical protein
MKGSPVRVRPSASVWWRDLLLWRGSRFSFVRSSWGPFGGRRNLLSPAEAWRFA